MACYIASSNNRFYVAIESSYGVVPSIAASHRFSALKLAIRQDPDQGERRDKTGSRTFSGVPGPIRRRTRFELRTYIPGLGPSGAGPAQAALVESALGEEPRVWDGGTVAHAAGPAIAFATSHGLSPGQAVAFGGEIRFVLTTPDASTVILNAPFTITPSVGSLLGRTISYFPAKQLKSVSIFDYWDPPSAVQRVLYGAGVERMQIRINGDYHEFSFSGEAADVIDSVSFVPGEGGLVAFPPEPALTVFEAQVIPGHLGQAWLGAVPDRFFTLTAAEVSVVNNLDVRSREFGSVLPKCLVPGPRRVELDFDLYEDDDDATKALYQAARQRSPIEVMFQLGNTSGQLCGVYMKSVIPEVPEFNDNDRRLQWQFARCRAQGIADDEIVVAFA
jgi:hypothetical protein